MGSMLFSCALCKQVFQLSEITSTELLNLKLIVNCPTCGAENQVVWAKGTPYKISAVLQIPELVEIRRGGDCVLA